MAYTAPTFNLACKIWRDMGTGGAYGSPDVTATVNLTPGRRTFESNVGSGTQGTLVQYMELLLPKLTDIRGPWNFNSPDLVEVPAGSNRFYQVEWVDDVAKGFQNEYRIALITMLLAGTNVFGIGLHPLPVPLP